MSNGGCVVVIILVVAVVSCSSHFEENKRLKQKIVTLEQSLDEATKASTVKASPTKVGAEAK